MIYFSYNVDMLMLNDTDCNAELLGVGTVFDHQLVYKVKSDPVYEVAIPTVERYLNQQTEITIWDIDDEDLKKLEEFAEEMEYQFETVKGCLLDGTEYEGLILVSTFEYLGITSPEVMDLLEEVYNDFGLDSAIVFRASSYSILNMETEYTPE